MLLLVNLDALSYFYRGSPGEACLQDHQVTRVEVVADIRLT